MLLWKLSVQTVKETECEQHLPKKDYAVVCICTYVQCCIIHILCSEEIYLDSWEMKIQYSASVLCSPLDYTIIYHGNRKLDWMGGGMDAASLADLISKHELSVAVL